MTLMFDSGMIVLGEITCLSFLAVEGLNGELLKEHNLSHNPLKNPDTHMKPVLEVIQGRTVLCGRMKEVCG